MSAVSYAHMGTSAIPINFLLKQLGNDVVFPPQPTAHTLSLGAQHAPEFACIPFKIVLGTYIEVLERGANVLISGGGLGPCRAGYYGEMHRKILNQLGYDPEMVFFWPPLKTPVDFLRKIKRLKGRHSWRQTWQKIKVTLDLIDAIDEVEQKAHFVRSRQQTSGSTDRPYAQALEYFKNVETRDDIEQARQAGLKELDKVDYDPDYVPLRVGIIGEIYVQLEPFANFFVEQFLGEQGAEPHRSIYLSHYTRWEIFRQGDPTTAELARPYIPIKIGGHGQNSIGDVVGYANKGYDGAIQLAPFTCVPEIVAKSIMPELSRKYDIPVLTLFIDEQTGLAGVQTRLEAFIDLMKQRQKRSIRSDSLQLQSGD